MEGMPRPTTVLLVAAFVVGSSLVFSQGFGGFGGFGGFMRQNDPPDTEFVFARLHYGASRRARFGGSGWAHDYPIAEQHINQIMSEATGLNVERMSYRIVELGSPELFQYPFSYISEAGEMNLTEGEVVNLREYLNRGGFIMVDDFDGPYDLQVFRQNMLRVFPEREMILLNIQHPIFNSFYSLNPQDFPSPYNYGPGHSPAFYGYSGADGNLSMIICHDNDIGDFWEYIDQPRFPLEPSSESLRFGINFVIYAMTH
jgi:hypothetical protein